jgi:hypothetical protein
LTAAVQSNVIVERTIVYANFYSPPFYCSASTIAFSCTNSFAGIGGNWSICLPDQSGRNGNISVDPLFCDVDDLTLQADSPCLPGNHPNGADCGLIGALGAGCGFPNAVQQETWGRLKGRFSP